MMGQYKQILIIIIICIVFFILGLLIAAVGRRILNARKYAALDGYRDRFRRTLSDAISSGTIATVAEDLRARPLSLQWRAVEEVLFERITDAACEKEVAQLFVRLGYRDYYENRLKSKRAITKASAIDKLGKMRSESSTALLVEILKTEKTPEVLTVTVRALNRIGSPEGLKGILERLPELYGKSLISHKTVESSLVKLNANAVPVLVSYGEKSEDPKIKATLLEALSHLPATPLSFSFAAAHLGSSDAEVRARAVRVFGSHDAAADRVRPELLLPLLTDPVWFVRLQAARALERLRYERAVDELGALLLDSNWQVRNAAARALASIGDASLDVFLNILQHTDRYAKESICEEAGKTRFTQGLIANLMSGDRRIYGKSRAILGIMHSLNFSTPLHDYMAKEDNDALKQEIVLLMQETECPPVTEPALVPAGLAGAYGNREGTKA
jgi:HEAT repeat protein